MIQPFPGFAPFFNHSFAAWRQFTLVKLQLILKIKRAFASIRFELRGINNTFDLLSNYQNKEIIEKKLISS